MVYFLTIENHIETVMYFLVAAFITRPYDNPTLWAIGSVAVQLAFTQVVVILRK